MIQVEREPKVMAWERLGFEKCVFCRKETAYWHKATNNPVCLECAETHRTAELISGNK